jgi:D-glycero-D-manno-heptose 1,7-bisphosphate phosphatase
MDVQTYMPSTRKALYKFINKTYAERFNLPTDVLDKKLDPEACQKLKQAGYLLIVVTNQPDVGRGWVRPETMEEMHRRLQQALPVDQIISCTDPSEKPGPRRKPAPGMLLEAAARWQIDFGRSFIVGDRKGDIDAGQAVGCRGIFINRNYLEPQPENPLTVCNNLLEAAKKILQG